MRVTYEVGSYNERRYGKPWIAKVLQWDIGKQPVIEFGAAISRWIAEIDAEPGQIIRYGQKDYRNKNGTVSRWAIVDTDGDYIRTTAGEARKHWLAGCPVLTPDQIEAD